MLCSENTGTDGEKRLNNIQMLTTMVLKRRVQCWVRPFCNFAANQKTNSCVVFNLCVGSVVGWRAAVIQQVHCSYFFTWSPTPRHIFYDSVLSINIILFIFLQKYKTTTLLTDVERWEAQRVEVEFSLLSVPPIPQPTEWCLSVWSQNYFSILYARENIRHVDFGGRK